MVGLGPVHAKRERERLEGTEGTVSTTTVYGARRLAGWPDLAPTTVYGFQLSQYQTLNFHLWLSKSVIFCFFFFTARVSTSDSTVYRFSTWDVGFKICDFLSFFFFSLLACRTCRSRVDTASEKPKKKRKKTLTRHGNPASRTRSGVQHVSDIDTTPKMACTCNLGKNTEPQTTQTSNKLD